MKTKNGTKTVQRNQKTVQKRYSKSDHRHWMERVEKRTENGSYQIRLRMEKRQTWFDLFTTNKVHAAKKALEIFQHAKANGLKSAISEYRYSPEERASIHTVGQFVDAVLELGTSVRPSTVNQYAGAFRQIAFELNTTGTTRERYAKMKFDYKGGGRQEWLEKVDAIELESITTDAVKDWRKTKSLTTAASQIRQAKAFVAITRGEGDARKHLRAKLPATLPFAEVKTNAPKAKRHRTILGASGEALATLASAELKEGDPEAYKAFLLCFYAGLRKEEADSLYWDQIDLRNGIIAIQEHDYFSPKSEESNRDVDLSESVCAELAELKARSKGVFVLHGRKALPVEDQYKAYYRCKPMWGNLNAWLKSKGVTARKPIHYLRKESGSYIASAFDIEAARQHLGHADIQVTSAHYSDKKAKRAIPAVSIQPVEDQKKTGN